MNSKEIVKKLLQQANIEINGPNPWDLQVLDERFYNRVLKNPSLGLGESYMDGWWNCVQMDEMIAKIAAADIPQQTAHSFKMITFILLNKFFNFQTEINSKVVAEKHYNLGNDLFELMLDKSMNYSCGYWKYATNLEEAERDKMELTCQKLMLKPGMKVLDVGCGWGSFAYYAAKNYGVEVVGITIAENQKKVAEEKCKGLPVEIKLLDYRSPPNQVFDRIVSVGMFEHVGYKNYHQFMQIMHAHLSDTGIFLLHTIGYFESTKQGDPWMHKYIFPFGMLPSIAQIGKSIENLFILEDLHNFGADYDKTLMAWHANFNAHWEQLNDKYDERFKRMWNFYLLSCAGVFRARKTNLWQFVLTKKGMKGGYKFRDLTPQR